MLAAVSAVVIVMETLVTAGHFYRLSLRAEADDYSDSVLPRNPISYPAFDNN